MGRVLLLLLALLAGCAAPAPHHDANPYRVCKPYNQPACGHHIVIV